MANRHFWNKKKVLVTGHTGFVGTWICLYLQLLGANLVGVSLEEEANSLYSKVKSELKIKNYYSDLRNAEDIERIIIQEQVELVLHLAAFGFIRECHDNPTRSYSTNVVGTVNLLEAVRKSESVRNILIVSSDKVYRNEGTNERGFFNENDFVGGFDTYSCSKTCEDLIAQSYFHTYFQKQGKTVTIVRPGNILGGGDHIKTRLLPNMLDRLERKEIIDIRHPNAIRPWQHVLDAINAYLTVVEANYTESKDNAKMDIYNVGPYREGQMTVGEIAVYIASKYKGAKIEIAQEKTEINESMLLEIDNSKIIRETNWLPLKNIHEILDDIFEFWLRCQNENTFDVCIDQIRKYQIGIEGK